MKKGPAAGSSSKRPKKWQDLSEDEVKELQRQRNIAYLKKSRDKQKAQEQHDKELFERNERQIERLEHLAERLETELRTSSHPKNRNSSNSSNHGKRRHTH